MASLDIQDLTIGISAKGMDDYKEELKASLLKTSKDKINNIADIETAINGGWQGISKDNFLKQFAAVRESICNDLDTEYKDLEFRLTQVEQAYFSIDKDLNDLNNK